MLRPGRLDKLLYVPLPSADARVDILRAASRRTPLALDVSRDSIARDVRCNGFSGADLSNLINVAHVVGIISKDTDHKAMIEKVAKETGFRTVNVDMDKNEPDALYGTV